MNCRSGTVDPATLRWAKSVKLFHAVAAGDAKELSDLIQVGFDIESKDGKGWISATYAVLNGHAACLSHLIKPGAISMSDAKRISLL